MLTVSTLLDAISMFRWNVLGSVCILQALNAVSAYLPFDSSACGPTLSLLPVMGFSFLLSILLGLLSCSRLYKTQRVDCKSAKFSVDLA